MPTTVGDYNLHDFTNCGWYIQLGFTPKVDAAYFSIEKKGDILNRVVIHRFEELCQNSSKR